MNGTSSLYNCALNTFTNDNTSNTLSPLVLLSSTKTTTQTIANCGFIYSTSGTRPTTSGYNLGVKVTGTTPICLLYNSFVMTGTSPSTDNIVQCPNTITHYNNACSPANAYKIGGGGSHYAFNTAS